MFDLFLVYFKCIFGIFKRDARDPQKARVFLLMLPHYECTGCKVNYRKGTQQFSKVQVAKRTSKAGKQNREHPATTSCIQHMALGNV